jgi:hypothetical protein
MTHTYTLAQLRNGTGFPRGAQFIMVSDRSQVPEPREWGWQGDPRTELDDAGLPTGDPERPAPEGLAVFAHWSASHDGINVEMDVPDGLRVTVHYNGHCVVDQQVRADGVIGYNFLEGSTTRLAPGAI